MTLLRSIQTDEPAARELAAKKNGFGESWRFSLFFPFSLTLGVVNESGAKVKKRPPPSREPFLFLLKRSLSSRVFLSTEITHDAPEKQQQQQQPLLFSRAPRRLRPAHDARAGGPLAARRRGRGVQGRGRGGAAGREEVPEYGGDYAVRLRRMRRRRGRETERRGKRKGKTTESLFVSLSLSPSEEGKKNEKTLLSKTVFTPSLAIDSAVLHTVGRTPEASMASALYTDVKKKGSQATFAKVEEGRFGLWEWEQKGGGAGRPAAAATEGAKARKASRPLPPPPETGASKKQKQKRRQQQQQQQQQQRKRKRGSSEEEEEESNEEVNAATAAAAPSSAAPSSASPVVAGPALQPEPSPADTADSPPPLPPPLIEEAKEAPQKQEASPFSPPPAAAAAAAAAVEVAKVEATPVPPPRPWPPSAPAVDDASKEMQQRFAPRAEEREEEPAAEGPAAPALKVRCFSSQN